MGHTVTFSHENPKRTHQQVEQKGGGRVRQTEQNKKDPETESEKTGTNFKKMLKNSRRANTLLSVVTLLGY